MVSQIRSQSGTVAKCDIPETKAGSKPSGQLNLSKAFTATVGCLAALQGFGLANARPGEQFQGLAEPLYKNLLDDDTRLINHQVMPEHMPKTFELDRLKEDCRLQYMGLSARGRALLSSDNNHVTNESGHDIVATTSYECFDYCEATSKFVNRLIPSGKTDFDEHCQQGGEVSTALDPSLGRRGQAGSLNIGCGVPRVALTLAFATAHDAGTFHISPDQSVVLKNVPNGAGIDVFAVKYGSLTNIDGKALGQIYNN